MERLPFTGGSFRRALADQCRPVCADGDEQPARRRSGYTLKHQHIGQHDPGQQGRKAWGGMSR